MERLWLVVLILLIGCKSESPKKPPPFPNAPQSMYEQITSAKDIDGETIGKPPAQATIVVMFASWCGFCQQEIKMLKDLTHPDDSVRVVGINYFEEFDERGSEQKMRDFVEEAFPRMRVVRASYKMWQAFGSPSKIPNVYVFDRDGGLVKAYLRHKRPPPSATELKALLFTLR